MSMNNEIVREFLLEAHENLSLLDSDLVILEERPTEKGTLAQVFRTLHSIKGTAGFIGLPKLQAVAHAGESLLSRLRDGELRFNRSIATALLQVVDAMRFMLASIEKSGNEGDGDYTSLIAELDRLRMTGGGEAAGSAAVPESPPPAAPAVPATLVLPPRAFGGVDFPRASEREASEMTMPLPAMPPLPAASAMPRETIQASPPAPPTVDEEPFEPRPTAVADTNIRVDVTLLDKLMTLVGELVLARNQIIRYSASYGDTGFQDAVQRLSLLTTELQESVMKTRMQPIGNVWNKFPRIVRDLAVGCQKKVRFEMEGQETELDKTLIEAIRDPLTHIVRNAVDHGIEPPDVRRERGKPEEGRLRMHAFHEGGKVIIEIQDDGGGIHVERVRERAIQNKIISPQEAALLSHAELLRLILLPGFSTAEKVTQFSGRGVGMDVVRTNIEKIGGTVDLESVEGQGTTIRTKIPLTLAIVPALMVSSAGQRYAIPQVSLVELVRVESEHASTAIESIQGAPVYRLRGNLLPLVDLNEQLGLAIAQRSDRDLNIVVLQAEDRQFGLVVDEIRDTEEIVVKPLQKQLKGLNTFAGATILGDGRVALILHVVGLAERAGVISGVKARSLVQHQTSGEQPADQGESYLIFSGTLGGQMALPLSQVARLEEIPRESMETVGGRQVVQYRGEILPLVDVSRQLDRLSLGSQTVEASARDRVAELPEVAQVVVCGGGNGPVGLVVGQILDVVHARVAGSTEWNRPGVLFTAVVQEKVTEFVDLQSLVR